MAICKICKKNASFNYKGKRPEYCKSHKKDGMCDVIHQLCLDEECGKRASFGYKGKNEEYCKKHKKDGMVDVVSNLCLFEGCESHPSFNYKGERPKYCKIHKDDGMVDVSHKLCLDEECNIRATFGYKGKSPEYCKSHKKDGMIDVTRRQLCLDEECDKRPSFGYKGKEPEYCKKHKKDGMVDVVSNICVSEGCEKHANFNYKGEKAKYCFIHKDDNMIDVAHRRCIHCDFERANPKYGKYCRYCFISLFPEHKISRAYRTKEKVVVDYIKETFIKYDWIQDKRLVGGCSKRRIDLSNDFGNFVLGIEIDENQHSNYECELKRNNELWNDINCRPLVLIRFNPDGYTDKDGTKYTSPWRATANGTVLLKTRQEEWDARITKLKKTIKQIIREPPTEEFTQLKLFYTEESQDD